MAEKDYKLSAWLRQAYHTLEMDDTADEIEVRDTYYRLVGDLITRLTWSVNYSKGTLKVKVASAALKQELTFRKDSLIEKINLAMGRKVVQKIIFI